MTGQPASRCSQRMKRCSSSTEVQVNQKCIKRAQQKRKEQEDDRYKACDLQRQGGRGRFARQQMSGENISGYHQLLQKRLDATYLLRVSMSSESANIPDTRLTSKALSQINRM